MTSLSKLLTATAVLLVVPLSGCDSSSDSPASGPGTTFYGTYADEAGNAGTVELVGVSSLTTTGIVLAVSEGTPLDGELRIGGEPPISLHGRYDRTAGAVAFASDDGTYSFNGTVTAGQGRGFGFGPGGPATFVIFLGGTPDTVEVYCGTATCTSPPGCEAEGAFNVVVDGSEALMTVNVDGAVSVGAGTANASDVHFMIDEEQVELTVQGEISGTIVSGTWTDEAKGTSGTWSGSTTQCQAARR